MSAALRRATATVAVANALADGGRAPGSTPLFLAIRVRTLHLDVASGRIDVGLRLFGFWKSGLSSETYPEGTVLRQKHGEITKEVEREIPEINLLGKVVRENDAESDREVKFHHVTIETADGTFETDTMITVFQYRTIEEMFLLHEFPFDEQTLALEIRLPKSNAKDAHFGIRVSDSLHVEKENIRPRFATSGGGGGSDGPRLLRRESWLGEVDGHGALEMSPNVVNLLNQQWSILSCDLIAGNELEDPKPDRALFTLRLRRKHEYYLTRMLAPSGVCATLSMTAWNVEHHAFGERAAILVTLFLALVASTTSYAVNLPKLPYLTNLDRYLSACLTFTTLVTVGCVLGTPRGAEAVEHKQVGGGEGDDDFSAALDRASMMVLTTLWLSYNGWFFGRNLLEQQRARLSVSLGGARTQTRYQSFRNLPELATPKLSRRLQA